MSRKSRRFERSPVSFDYRSRGALGISRARRNYRGKTRGFLTRNDASNAVGRGEETFFFRASARSTRRGRGAGLTREKQNRNTIRPVWTGAHKAKGERQGDTGRRRNDLSWYAEGAGAASLVNRRIRGPLLPVARQRARERCCSPDPNIFVRSSVLSIVLTNFARARLDCEFYSTLD